MFTSARQSMDALAVLAAAGPDDPLRIGNVPPKEPGRALLVVGIEGSANKCGVGVLRYSPAEVSACGRAGSGVGAGRGLGAL